MMTRWKRGSLCLIVLAVMLQNVCMVWAANEKLQCDQETMYSYEAMEQDLQGLQRKYSQIVSLDHAGETVDGRTIYHVRIGAKDASKQIFIFGSIHAREYITTQLIMRQMEDFLKKLDSGNGTYRGKSYSALLTDAAIHIVPMSNPDGVSISQYGMDGVKKSSTRQTLYHIYELDKAVELGPYLKKWKSNAQGIDINRNFDAKWDLYDDHLGHPSADHYKGEAVGCTKEAQALIQLTEQYAFDRTISYYVQGEVIYWYFAQEGPLLQESIDFAQEIAAVTGYSLDENYEKLDPAGYKDWAIDKKKIPSLTIEVGTGAVPLDQSQLSKIWNENQNVWAATLYTLK